MNVTGRVSGRHARLPKTHVIALFFILRWVDFSIWQSLLLTLLVVIGLWGYERVAFKEPPSSLYRVVISPKFDRLLLDYKLLKSVDEYDRLYALWEKKDQKLIAFTVLRDQANGDPLVYSDAYHYFQSDLNFDEPIEALVFKGRGCDDLYLRDSTLADGERLISPSVYFKWGDLGLNVRERWWKKVCAENPTREFTKTEVDYDFITGSANLTIATIPPIAFYMVRTPTMTYKESEKLWEVIDKDLALGGWERQKPDVHAEVKDPWIRIEHKYFHVQYRKM
ncbi:MAG TPA: hypothetical protein VIX14_09050 [Terriglobales bacterium]